MEVLMKVCFLTALAVALCSAIYGAEQLPVSVYPHAPTPVFEQMRERRPNARTKEYKQIYKNEKLKTYPSLWQGSWLQRKSRNAWNWLSGTPTARQTDFENAYMPKSQQQTNRGWDTFLAYQKAAERDQNIAEKERAKASMAAQYLRGKINALEGEKKVNRRLRREVNYGSENEKLQNGLDAQYHSLSREEALLEKEKDKRFKEARDWDDAYTDALLKNYGILMSTVR